MNSQYFYVYNNFDLVQTNLQQQIQSMFTQQQINKPMTYQEILLCLDQKCQKFINNKKINKLTQENKQNNINSNSRYNPENTHLANDQFKKLYYRADRNISKEIFDSSPIEHNNKVTLRNFIWKYIELLETAKLCLIREQAKQKIIQHRMKQAEKNLRQKTYIYIKLIQASIHSRYSDSPCFQYRIHPSSIPTVTVVNSLNPVLNHEYTLEMKQKQFYVYFYESGIQIYKWRFQLGNFTNDGEFYQSIAAQPVTFQIQVKMLPQKTSQEMTQLNAEKQKVQIKLQLSRKAFQNLCYYMPFLQAKVQEENQDEQNRNVFWKFTSSLFSFLPFLKNHVPVLHYILICLIFVECLAAVSWAVQFVDVIISSIQLIIAFGLIGLLYDRTKINVGMYLWVGIFGMFLSTIKTIWGALLMPFGMPKYPLILGISIIFKVIALFFVWICTIRAEQVPAQRIKYLYGVQFSKEQIKQQEQKPIFKANQNYYKNKKNQVLK